MFSHKKYSFTESLNFVMQLVISDFHQKTNFFKFNINLIISYEFK